MDTYWKDKLKNRLKKGDHIIVTLFEDFEDTKRPKGIASYNILKVSPNQDKILIISDSKKTEWVTLDWNFRVCSINGYHVDEKKTLGNFDKVTGDKLPYVRWALEKWYKIPKGYPQKYEGSSSENYGGRQIFSCYDENATSEVGEKLVYSLDFDEIYLGMMDCLKKHHELLPEGIPGYYAFKRYDWNPFIIHRKAHLGDKLVGELKRYFGPGSLMKYNSKYNYYYMYRDPKPRLGLGDNQLDGWLEDPVLR